MARTRKPGFRKDDRKQKCTYFAGIYPTTNAVVCVAVHPKEMKRYARAHHLVPKDIEKWTEAQLVEVANAVADDRPETWRRALVLLAHHQSQVANDLLAVLREQVPPELAEQAEMAWAESLAWLGYSYVRDVDGRVTLVPAGTPIPGVTAAA